jgi:hypothetical protein
MHSETRTTEHRTGPKPRRMLVALLAMATALAMAIGTAPAAQAKPAETTKSAVAAKAAKAKAPSALSAQLTGTLQDGTGKVDGLFNITKFAKRNGKLVAVGKFTGTITDAAGKVTSGSKKIAVPLATAEPTGAQKLAPNAAAAAPAGCQVLDLVLGPLDLNLLGLKVHLDVVKLNITAEPGPGNLLGNLLCAVAGLLDGGTGLNGILNSLTTLLNRLLAVLG